MAWVEQVGQHSWRVRYGTPSGYGFLNLSTMEPYDDQWAFLSTLGRMSPREVNRKLRHP
jgi:hypothetical protein